MSDNHKTEFYSFKLEPECYSPSAMPCAGVSYADPVIDAMAQKARDDWLKHDCYKCNRPRIRDDKVLQTQIKHIYHL